MDLPTAATMQPHVKSVVAKVQKELTSDVARIRYRIDTDWTGDPAIFFRVVLRDTASRGKRLETATAKIRAGLLEGLKPLDLGLLFYFNFRSESEQAELREKAWA